MRHLVEQIQTLEARLREGGGQARIDRQHQSGKMTARERIAALSDPASRFLEIGLLIAYDRYDGQAPSAGIVTGLGRIEGRSEGHTSELQSRQYLVCRLLLEKNKTQQQSLSLFRIQLDTVPPLLSLFDC